MHTANFGTFLLRHPVDVTYLRVSVLYFTGGRACRNTRILYRTCTHVPRHIVTVVCVASGAPSGNDSD